MKIDRRSFLKAAGIGAGTFTVQSLLVKVANSAETVPVGVIIPGSITDRGWMEGGYNGMLQAREELKDRVKITSIENVSMADMEQALTALAMANPFIVGAGGQCEAAAEIVAERFPHVKFSVIGGGGGQSLPNLVVTDGRQAQIAYVAGVAAGLLSKTGVVSFVGGIELPPIVNASIEFGNGAKSVNPNIKYLPNLTGDFDDVAKAKQATLSAVDQGADIHYHIMNLGLRGLEQAARERGTKIIGSYFDRCSSEPIYAAFSVTGTGYMVRDQIKRFLDGTWTPGFLPYGLEAGPEASNFVFCTPNPELAARVEQAKQDIISGKVVTLPS